MGISMSNWRAPWWKEETHGVAWDRVKDAIRHIWEQDKALPITRVEGETLGHHRETKPNAPARERAAPARAIGNWTDAEIAFGYGYGARRHFATEHPTWSSELEGKLRGDWDAARSQVRCSWEDARPLVRHGYDFGAPAARRLSQRISD